MILEGIKKFYEEKYKALMIIPFLILFFALAQISIQYAQTGEFMHRGVSLKGGISIAIPNQFMPLDDLENILSEKFPNGDISVRSIADTGLIIDTSDVSQKDLIAALEDQFGPLKDYSIGEIVDVVRNYKPNLKVEITKSPIINQKSYNVSDKKLRNLGFVPEDDLEISVIKTIKLFEAIKNE